MSVQLFTKTTEANMVIQEEIKMFSRANKHISVECAKDYSPAASLIALCFKSSTMAHFAHLQSSTLAEHKILASFYKKIEKKADKYAEVYQGRYGVIEVYPYIRLHTYCGVHIVETVREWIDEHRCHCGSQAEIQAEIDEIVAFCDHILYKLHNLK